MRRITWGLAWASVVLAATALVLAYLDRSWQPGGIRLDPSWVSQLLAAVGAAVVVPSSRPAVRATGSAGLALTGGTLLSLSGCCKSYAVRALVADVRLLAARAMWLYYLADVVTWCCLALALLLFPDGGLPSPRWRPASWCAGGIVAATVAMSGRPCYAWSGHIRSSSRPESGNPDGARGAAAPLSLGARGQRRGRRYPVRPVLGCGTASADLVRGGLVRPW